MSRSGYNDYIDDNWQLIRWRGAVKSAINGKRGQAFLKEMLAAMDAMPFKMLARDELETTEKMTFSHWGMHEVDSFCAIGTVGKARGMDMSDIDPYDRETVAAKFGIAYALACEIMYENDETYWREDHPELRYDYMRKWITSHIKE